MKRMVQLVGALPLSASSCSALITNSVSLGSSVFRIPWSVTSVAQCRKPHISLRLTESVLMHSSLPVESGHLSEHTRSMRSASLSSSNFRLIYSSCVVKLRSSIDTNFIFESISQIISQLGLLQCLCPLEFIQQDEIRL